jgi:hypothetical protein
MAGMAGTMGLGLAAFVNYLSGAVLTASAGPGAARLSAVPELQEDQLLIAERGAA